MLLGCAGTGGISRRRSASRTHFSLLAPWSTTVKFHFCRLVLLSAALLVTTLTGAPSQEPKSAGKTANLNNVSLEIAALQVLHDLELPPAKLAALAKLAHDSAPKGEKRDPAKASAEISKALTDLHAAYGRGVDEKIGEAREKLDELMEKQEPEIDNRVTLTEVAKEKAEEALKLLNVRQAGAFLATLDHTDPIELLSAALEQVRSLKAAELEEEIASVAEEAAWLLDGLDTEEGDKTKDKVTALLKRASALKTDAVFNRQRKALEEEVKKIVGDVDNTEVLSHILEHGMAELLSNPRLEAAIRIQQRVPASSRPDAKAKAGAVKSSK